MTAPSELIIDSFAGGGGASLGIEMALGRSPDIAINHDAEALSLHRANHPGTAHLPRNLWKVDPVAATGGRPVGLLWGSPDCRHHSRAKGSKPVNRSVRDLAWVIVRWAKQVRPRVIIVENVGEFSEWGPVLLDGMPCKERKGKTFDLWVSELRRLGYRVEWRELRASIYGAPTIRKRLYVIARRDGRPIMWPPATFDDPKSDAVRTGKLPPWRTAGNDVIDWSIPCPSIFLTREEGRKIGVNRPLAENTMARIAKGVKRYVIDAASPFIVPVKTWGGGGNGPRSADEPLRTSTTSKRGEHALVTPFVTKFHEGQVGQPNGGALAAMHLQRQFGASVGSGADEPVGTVTAGGGGKTAVVAAHITKFAENSVGHMPDEPLHTAMAGAPRHGVVAAFLAQHNTDMVGHDAREPVSTIVGKGCTQAVVSAGLVNLKGSDRRGSAIEAPAPSVTAQGGHLSEVRAFLIKYFGTDQDPQLDEPLHTVTTKDRFGLVTVKGELYQIVDIGMRMLTPRELFRAQGFPDATIIDKGLLPDGTWVPLTKTTQVRLCGNSVCPPVAEALVRANYVPDEKTATATPKSGPSAAPLFDHAGLR